MFQLGADTGIPIRVACPECLFDVRISNAGTILECVKCRNAYSMIEGKIPSFIKDTNKRSQKKGFANSLFATRFGAQFYSIWIAFKHKLQEVLRSEDAVIGLDQIVANKQVLDLGCGPDLDSLATEYPHYSPSLYVGVDYSESFVISASEKHGDSKHAFLRASADSVPFQNKSFDVTLALFTIHHVTSDPTKVVSELARVAKENIVIFDHVKSDSKAKAMIQKLYWRIFDGGEHYLTYQQWTRIFAEYNLVILKTVTSGVFFKHVIKFVLEPQEKTNQEDLSFANGNSRYC